MWVGNLASLIMPSFTAHIHKCNILQVAEFKGQYYLRSNRLKVGVPLCFGKKKFQWHKFICKSCVNAKTVVQV